MTSQRTRDRLVQRLREKGITDERVLAVIASVPRHLFVDEAMASHAYEDKALPIGHRQTISQPFVVARMTEALLADGVPARALEIGTGSGYQAAVLSRLIPRVYTVERIRELHLRARDLFARLGYDNILSRYADGGEGWSDKAPYDAIILTAALDEVPTTLLDQLGEGGRLVAPLGPRDRVQELRVIHRTHGQLRTQSLEQVSFVPFLPGME